jgi:hypothetical protein
MARELLLIDTTSGSPAGQTDRYARLLTGGQIVRAADGVLIPFNAANVPAGAIVLSDADAAHHYTADVPPNTPTGVYRVVYYQRLGATPSIDDPAYPVDDPPLEWTGTAGLPAGATTQVTKTILTRTFEQDGVLADVTSVVLEDPTGTYGVRRTDTNAVVVDAGTPMVRQSVGFYALTFNDPAFGLTYQYYEKITFPNGNVLYEEKHRSGPGALPSRSYLLRGDADYLASMLPASMLTAWLSASATADAKSRALEQASSDVDAAGPFQGRKYVTSQIRAFPRVAYETLPAGYVQQGRTGLADTVWDWDEATNAAVVPMDVKQAVLYQANAILAGGRGRIQEAIHGGLASQSVGGMSESYRPGGSVTDGLGVVCQPAAALLSRYRLRTGRLL